jgi:predicted nicotinamide N-methyase
VWNGARVISDYLEQNAKELVIGKNVLEFGAGGGLPSLVCAMRGAITTVITDYPDPDLVENLQKNVTALQEKHTIHGKIYTEVRTITRDLLTYRVLHGGHYRSTFYPIFHQDQTALTH